MAKRKTKKPDLAAGSAKPAAKSTAVKSDAASEPVYQLKITLMGTQPPVWRRFQVRDVSLAELHLVIQEVMGWEDAHLHEFDFRGRRFGVPDPDSPFPDDAEDEASATLTEALGRNRVFGYLYDFGDSWQHRVELEKRLEAEPDVTYPRCVDGKRACPPEDCGGVWGYADLLEAIEHPKSPRHRELLEWVGDDFDPEAFDAAEVNERLADLRRPRRGGWGW